jgi:hypothetical protein
MFSQLHAVEGKQFMPVEVDLYETIGVSDVIQMDPLLIGISE